MSMPLGERNFAVAPGPSSSPATPGTPARVVTKDSPLYMTGTQSLRGFASGTHVSAVVAYEELS